jgi:hypothetical protein
MGLIQVKYTFLSFEKSLYVNADKNLKTKPYLHYRLE